MRSTATTFILLALLATTGCAYTDAIIAVGEAKTKDAISQKQRVNDTKAKALKAALCGISLGAAGRTMNQAELTAAFVLCPLRPGVKQVP